MLVNLALGHEALVAGELAETAGAAEKDVGTAGFGEEQEHGNEDGSRGPDGDEEGPSPAFDGDGETAEKRAQGG